MVQGPVESDGEVDDAVGFFGDSVADRHVWGGFVVVSDRDGRCAGGGDVVVVGVLDRCGDGAVGFVVVVVAGVEPDRACARYRDGDGAGSGVDAVAAVRGDGDGDVEGLCGGRVRGEGERCLAALDDVGARGDADGGGIAVGIVVGDPHRRSAARAGPVAAAGGHSRGDRAVGLAGGVVDGGYLQRRDAGVVDSHGALSGLPVGEVPRGAGDVDGHLCGLALRGRRADHYRELGCVAFDGIGGLGDHRRGRRGQLHRVVVGDRVGEGVEPGAVQARALGVPDGHPDRLAGVLVGVVDQADVEVSAVLPRRQARPRGGVVVQRAVRLVRVHRQRQVEPVVHHIVPPQRRGALKAQLESPRIRDLHVGIERLRIRRTCPRHREMRPVAALGQHPAAPVMHQAQEIVPALRPVGAFDVHRYFAGHRVVAAAGCGVRQHGRGPVDDVAVDIGRPSVLERPHHHPLGLVPVRRQEEQRRLLCVARIQEQARRR